MTNFKPARMPKAIEESVDAYYQTRKFSQKNFVKFNKDLCLTVIQRAAQKHGYDVTGDAGEFTFTRAGQVLQVTPKTFPFCIKTRKEA